MPRLVFAICVIILARLAQADSVVFSRELIKSEFDFGSLTIARIYDGRNFSNGPVYIVEVRKGDALIARLWDVSFDVHETAPDESFFVGISNRGHPDTAYLVIDSDGKLVALQNHSAKLHYCEQTISAIREWYNADKPDIQFEMVGRDDNLDVVRISVAGCDGGRVQLLDRL